MDGSFFIFFLWLIIKYNTSTELVENMKISSRRMKLFSKIGMCPGYCCKTIAIKLHQEASSNVFFFCYNCRENLPGHFKFKEYCPQVFRNLRERFGIDDLDYQVQTWKNSELDAVLMGYLHHNM